VTSADIFTGADPYCVTIRRIDGDATDGVGTIAIEDGLPGGTRIDGFPEIAGSSGHVPGVGFDRINGDITDPSGHESRPDGPKLQGADIRGFQALRGFGFF